jgi:hypothetical protein
MTQWFEPYGDTRHDKDAAERAFNFLVGWLANLSYIVIKTHNQILLTKKSCLIFLLYMNV